MNFIANGFATPDVAVFILRVTAGAFLACSGYHKLFNAGRRESLRQTFIADRIPFVRFNMVFVPTVEFIGGLALMLGFGTVFAAVATLAIFVVALITDGIGRIPDFQPIDKADWLCDLLYLCESVYIALLLAVLCIGPGVYSVDHMLF